jgi:hypothetical protein
MVQDINSFITDLGSEGALNTRQSMTFGTIITAKSGHTLKEKII